VDGGPEPDVLAAVALGGALGALARHGLGLAVGPAGTGWPWATLTANLSGSLLLGVLLVLVERGRGSRLARPFLGVGVLGGYTTMSTYGVETQQLLLAGRPGLAAGYACATLLGALAAVWAGAAMTRRLLPPAGRG
jgi:CrcB protein